LHILAGILLYIIIPLFIYWHPCLVHFPYSTPAQRVCTWKECKIHSEDHSCKYMNCWFLCPVQVNTNVVNTKHVSYPHPATYTYECGLIIGSLLCFLSHGNVSLAVPPWAKTQYSTVFTFKLSQQVTGL
jgi:hypothetical protein